jgi:hypothetical protein
MLRGFALSPVLSDAFSMFLMQMEVVARTKDATIEERPGGDGYDAGPSTPHDEGNTMPDADSDHQGTVASDQGREV